MPKVIAAQPAAQDLNRHGLFLVGDQRDLRHPGEHAGDLTHHPDVVDHRLSGLHPLLETLVDDHPARKRVARRVHDLRADGLARDALAQPQELAQVLVLGGQRLLVLQRRGVRQAPALELLVVPLAAERG